jgi:hypothetical protein
MRGISASVWIVGLFGLIAAAYAQTRAASIAGGRFDGTYAFVSATKLNAIYNSGIHVKRCGAYKGGPLTVVNDHARYGGGPGFDGRVGSQGDLTMRLVSPIYKSNAPGVEIIIMGRIDGNGTVRARRMSYYCRYDLIWQKISK